MIRCASCILYSMIPDLKWYLMIMFSPHQVQLRLLLSVLHGMVSISWLSSLQDFSTKYSTHQCCFSKYPFLFMRASETTANLNSARLSHFHFSLPLAFRTAKICSILGRSSLPPQPCPITICAFVSGWGWRLVSGADKIAENVVSRFLTFLSCYYCFVSFKAYCTNLR